MPQHRRRPPQPDAPAESTPAYEPQHPLVHGLGEVIGHGAGVAVTQLLALVPGWSDPVLGPDGRPVASVPGATRIGDHDLERRHEAVLGPRIDAYGDTLGDGWWRDLVEGVGEGATRAPGDTYRLESGLSDLLGGRRQP